MDITMATNGNGRGKPSKSSWNAAIFIIFVEMAERFAYYGMGGNLIIYFTQVLEIPVANAAKYINVWRGVSAFFPLLGAFIADSYLGRFNTIIWSTTIYFAGLLLLTIVSAIKVFNHRKLFTFLALYILSVGEGGHKPCVQTFAADQFDEKLPEDKVAKSSFFNWWYIGIVFAAALSIPITVYAQKQINWAAGYAIPTGTVAVALILFLIGMKTYRHAVPVGSPFTRVIQVFVAAVKKRRHRLEVNDDRTLCFDDDKVTAQILVHSNEFRWLDKAAIIDEIDAASRKRNNWRLCSVNQVEEVKQLLRLLPIWMNCFMFAAATAQQGTFFIKQGATMARSIGPHFQIEPALFQVITGLSILTMVPLYDFYVVPFARKFTKNSRGLTMLQRMGIGIVFAIFTMIVAALVEGKRVNIAKNADILDDMKATVPMQIWWLIPQFVLCGIADFFTVVAMQEFFYDQMPEEMRSIGAALYLSALGVGSFLSSGIISLVQIISSKYGNGAKWMGNNLNRAHLDYFYWILAGLTGISLFFFLWAVKGFVYKKVQSEEMSDA